ncbi:MAG: metallophosphoesterase [Candidatus Njordarchaeales archaeon]
MYERKEKLMRLLSRVEEIFESEPRVIDIYSDKVIFIGDLHGDWDAAEKIIKYMMNRKGIFVFLGDYVDRGYYSLEILEHLIQLKLEKPNNVFLLRGNHETMLVNEYYGFRSEVLRKFGKDGEEIYIKCNEVFAKMPLAVLVNDGEILALHGGIPIEVPSLNQINSLPKNDLYGERDPLLFQILWNDPDDSIEDFAPSPRGPGCYLFGRKVFEEFTRKNHIERIIRAHTFLQEGYRYFFDNKLLSIFSVLSYITGPVRGKIAEYVSGKIKITNVSDLPY